MLSAEQAGAMERTMLERHSQMYIDLRNARCIDPHKLDQRVRSYNQDVIKYDRTVAALNAVALKGLGGLHTLFSLTQEEKSRHDSIRAVNVGDQLAQCVERSTLPPSSDKRQGAPRHAHHIEGLLSEGEAAELARLALGLGFRSVVQEVPTNYEQTIPERSHTMCVLKSEPLAEWLWKRVQQFPNVFPKEIHDREGMWVPMGVNPCFRFNKYMAGQVFSEHVDDVYFSRDAQERSFLTVVIYLNDGFAGGDTVFLRGRKGGTLVKSFKPSTGNALVFQHDMLHEATEPIGSPAKMIVRTDIVFRRKK
eukprot:m.11900 g.11900  ORF g.11900 m.11900 type:complete len:307 (-) comp9042_c0_seq1:48-968(-)